MSLVRYTMLRLGRSSPEADRLWLQSGAIFRIVGLKSAAPTGRRAGSRVLGIGLDAFGLALKSIVMGCRGPFLATNPWIAVALRVTGRNNFAVTGLYADPGSRSWRLLRKTIGHARVVTTARVEAENWRAEMGSAAAVPYGNTFGYGTVTRSGLPIRIFIGGSSDRDVGAVSALVEEMKECPEPIHLDLCVGSLELPERVKTAPGVTVHGPVSFARFGELMAAAHVVYLPLLDKERAAGHMVAVGALECGTPFVASPTIGMEGYFSSLGAHAINPGSSVLHQLLTVANQHAEEQQAIREGWRRTHSLEAYVHHVVAAIHGLNEVG